MKYTLLLVFILYSSLIWPTDSIQVSDIGSSAEMIGRGNIEGFSKNASSVFENPASLHHIQRASFSTFGTRIFDEANYANLAYSWNNKWGHFGLGHMFVYVDGGADKRSDNPFSWAVSFVGEYFDQGEHVLLSAGGLILFNPESLSFLGDFAPDGRLSGRIYFGGCRAYICWPWIDYR